MNKYQEFLPSQLQLKNEDDRFMLQALKEAWKAFDEMEVPVGAVIVKDGIVIAKGHNQIELLRDATAHAEMICITSAESAIDNWRLKGATLYCTIEPCLMCAGAMLLSRLDRLVWGAKDIRHGANGSWIDVFSKKHPTHELAITHGVLEEFCQTPLKLFFQKRRKENNKCNIEKNELQNGYDGEFEN